MYAQQQQQQQQQHQAAFPSRSPPPLQHPIPTHPPFKVPDPPVTPGPAGASSSSSGGRPSLEADAHLTSVRPRGAAAAAAAANAANNASPGYVRYSSPPIHANANNPYAAPQNNHHFGQHQHQHQHPHPHHHHHPMPHQPGVASSSSSSSNPYGATTSNPYAPPPANPSAGGGGGFPNLSQFASLASMAAAASGMGGNGGAAGGGGGRVGGGGPGAPPGQGAGGVGGGVNAAGMMLNDATAQMGVQFGTQMARAGQEYVGRNFGSLLPLPLLKHYFNVSNSYVLHKLRIVLFPWRHKPWSRAQMHAVAAAAAAAAASSSSAASSAYGSYGGPASPYGEMGPSAVGSKGGPGSVTPSTPAGNGFGAGGGDGFAPPREDVNSPDLYIPSMAIVTYVLLVSVIRGLESRFHPEVLGRTSSRALAILTTEFVLVKLGCYLLNIQGDHTLVDLASYGGYKFVGAILTLGVGVLGMGRLVYWTTFFYTTAANAFFLLRSMRYVVLPDPSSTSSHTITHAQRSRRIQFLFGIALAQSVFAWLLIVGIWN